MRSEQMPPALIFHRERELLCRIFRVRRNMKGKSPCGEMIPRFVPLPVGVRDGNIDQRIFTEDHPAAFDGLQCSSFVESAVSQAQPGDEFIPLSRARMIVKAARCRQM